jgi:hypothetical protein
MFMDVQMPVLDGYEATKLLRDDELESVRKVLVIAMTASAIQGDREKCLAAGMDDYLAKPVRSEVLKKKLDAYVMGGLAAPNGAGGSQGKGRAEGGGGCELEGKGKKVEGGVEGKGKGKGKAQFEEAGQEKALAPAEAEAQAPAPAPAPVKTQAQVQG